MVSVKQRNCTWVLTCLFIWVFLNELPYRTEDRNDILGTLQWVNAGTPAEVYLHSPVVCSCYEWNHSGDTICWQRLHQTEVNSTMCTVFCGSWLTGIINSCLVRIRKKGRQGRRQEDIKSVMSWRKNDFFTVYKKKSCIQAVAFQMAEGTHSSKGIFDLEPL